MNDCIIIKDFLNYLKLEKHYSKHTHSSYATDLYQFADFVISNSDVDVNEQSHYIQQYEDTPVTLLVQTKSCIEKLLLTVDSDLVRKYMLLLDVKQYSKATASRKLACLRSFYKFLKKQNYLDLNPTNSVRLPRQIKKLPKVLEYKQVKKLLQMPSMNNWLGARDRAILETLYSTGIRVGELAALNMQDIGFFSEIVHIRTNSKKERILPLSSSSLQALQYYLEFRNKRAQSDCNFDPKALFVNKNGGRLRDRSVRRQMDKYLGMAGLDQSISPRTLRHSFATHMLKNGTELRKLQELLGYQTLSSTRVYSCLTTENYNGLSGDGLEKCVNEYEKTLVNA